MPAGSVASQSTSSAGLLTPSILAGVTAAGGEQFRHLDHALLPWASDLGERYVGRSRFGGEVGEYPGDGPGRHQLGAHPRHVGDVTLSAPLHQLSDELVELRGAQHTRRDRA